MSIVDSKQDVFTNATNGAAYLDPIDRVAWNLADVFVAYAIRAALMDAATAESVLNAIIQAADETKRVFR